MEEYFYQIHHKRLKLALIIISATAIYRFGYCMGEFLYYVLN